MSKVRPTVLAIAVLKATPGISVLPRLSGEAAGQTRQGSRRQDEQG